VLVIAKYEPLLARLKLSTLEQVKSFPRATTPGRRPQPREITRLVAEDNGMQRVFFMKRNWISHKKDGIASLFRRGAVWSIARQEWENARALETAGLRMAGLVAYGEECGPLWEHFSFIITEAAPGQTIDEFFRDCRDRTIRRRVLLALAKFVKKLHEAGMATPDLFTRHIFFANEIADPQFCLIDMARLDRCKNPSARTRARDLAALNVTASPEIVSARERVSFLRAYAGHVDRQFFNLIRRRMKRLLTRKKHRRAFLGEKL
jgi:hypothetical protein